MRATRLTPALTRRITGLVRIGAYPVTAAKANGVSASVWYSWLATGRGRHPARARGPVRACSRLVAAVERAEAECEAQVVARLTVAAMSDSRVAAALLERRWPERWSRRSRVEVVAPAPPLPMPPPLSLILADVTDRLP